MPETNNINNLRFDIDGKAYFLHYSGSDINVGDVIRPSGLRQNDTGDALRGFSYGYDAFNVDAPRAAVDIGRRYTEESGQNLNVYLTRANLENVFPDLNTSQVTRRNGKGN